LDDEDKKTILSNIKETTEWIESDGSVATAEELEEKLAEVQASVSPITSKLYGDAGGGGGGGPTPDDDDDMFDRSHDEL
jgi:heat shock protein 5